MRNKRTHITKNCEICNKDVKTTEDRVASGRGKYCSLICYAESKKGSTGYWKGKKRSMPWIKGEANHLYGKTPWNKGIKNPKMVGENNPRWVADRSMLKTDWSNAV